MLTRRNLLAAATLVAATPALSRPVAGLEGIDFDDPVQNLHQIMRVFGDAAGGDVLYWFHGWIYAMIPGRRPFPLVHFNGINAMRFTQRADGAYQSRHHSMSFIEDPVTQQLLDRFENPITGRTNSPRPNVFNGSEYEYAPAGTRMMRGNATSITPFHPGMWSFGAGHAWLTIDRPYSEAFGYPWAEARTYMVSLADLRNPAITSLSNTQHSTVTNPFPKWMEMPDDAGVALWQANGRKLSRVSDLPVFLQERCERYMPQLKDYDVF